MVNKVVYRIIHRFITLQRSYGGSRVLGNVPPQFWKYGSRNSSTIAQN